MFGHNTVGPGEGVTDHSGSDGAAAVWEWCHWARIVAQVGISPEDSLTRTELVIQPHVKLIRILVFGADTEIVIGRGFSAAGKDIRQWKPFQSLHGSRIKTIRWNCVAGKWVSPERSTNLLRGRRIVGGRGEYPLPLLAGGDRTGPNDSDLLPGALVVGKEKSLLFLDRAAQHEPILIATKERLGAS